MRRAIGALSLVELKLFLRDPVTVIFTLALPALWLYVLAEVFGNTPDPQGRVYQGVGPIDFYTPAYLALVVASLTLIGVPVHLASYRERGVLRRLTAVRVPATALLLSQLAVLCAGVTAGCVVLVGLARLSYGVAWPASWPMVLLALGVGLLAFAALGVLLGALLPTARAAQGICVMVWFVMLMLSGTGPPPEVLSGTMRGVGAALPLRHLVVAVQDPWLGRGANWAELGVLLGVMVVATVLAAAALRRRQ